MTDKLIQYLKRRLYSPATTDMERQVNHVLCETMDFIKHQQSGPHGAIQSIDIGVLTVKIKRVYEDHLANCRAKGIQSYDFTDAWSAVAELLRAELKSEIRLADEEQLGFLAEEIMKLLVDHVHNCGMPLRTKLCALLRPHVCEPKRESDRDDLIAQIKRLEEKNTELEQTTFRRFNNEDCWIYQGDGEDHLESLVCPVVISAKQLSAILNKKPYLTGKDIQEAHARWMAAGCPRSMALDGNDNDIEDGGPHGD
jgi:hypothetical protein